MDLITSQTKQSGVAFITSGPTAQALVSPLVPKEMLPFVPDLKGPRNGKTTSGYGDPATFSPFSHSVRGLGGAQIPLESLHPGRAMGQLAARARLTPRAGSRLHRDPP